MYARLNPPPPQQRYNYPVSVDRPFRVSPNLLCSQREILQQLWLLYVGIVCVLFSKVYTQVNSWADLDCVDSCDTGGISNIFFVYLCQYINCAVLFVHKETGLWGTFVKFKFCEGFTQVKYLIKHFTLQQASLNVSKLIQCRPGLLIRYRDLIRGRTFRGYIPGEA
jgi:hypothetical protein